MCAAASTSPNPDIATLAAAEVLALTGQHDALEASLVDAMNAAGLGAERVTVTGTASVGANRATVFVDIESAGEVTHAVAQIGSERTSSLGVSVLDEAALVLVAGNAGVPAPVVLFASENLGSENADVLVTSRVAGLSIPRRILRSIAELEHETGDAVGDGLAHQCGYALARLHSIPVEALPSTIERLDPADPHRAYCARLIEQLDELPTRHPAIRWGINWLDRNPPSRPAAQTLVHADCRNGNMLIDQGRLAAILDWELAHIGDPVEDLAWMCVRMWRFGNDHRPVGGFGSIQALREGYEDGGGTWRVDAFKWWLAARSAWWAIGLARQGAAAITGESDSIVHAASGRRVAELEYDLLTLIRSHTA